jgi:spermidine synthase
MSETAVLTPETGASFPAPQPRLRPVLLAIGCVSFGSLLLELSLTRLFSVVLFYHFAFLAVSVALLGLGAGGVFAYVKRDWLERWSASQLGAVLCLLNALAIVIVLEVVLHARVSLALTWPNFARLTVIYLAAAVPFFFTGCLFAVVFAREPRRIAVFYAADLLGASLACLAVVPALNRLGGPNAVLLAAFSMALAAFLWSRIGTGGRSRAPAALASVALLVLIAANHSGRLVDVIYAKGAPLDHGRLFARWNAISRVEVNQWFYIVIDADATTSLMRTDPHASPPPQWLTSAAPSTVNVLRPHGRYAVIGPGGGVDVLRAVSAGSPHVAAIEINPLIATTIMRQKFAADAHHLYEIPEVEMHVSDGRSWVRSTPERFDVVQMTLVDTWASTAAGAFALSENNLYTREAFREYFEHLDPGGMLAITRWEFRRPREALRVVSEAIDALLALGVPQQEIPRHFVVVADGKLDEDGISVTTIAKRSAFTPEEEAAVAEHLRANPELALLYSPAIPQPNPFTELIRSTAPHSFAAKYSYDITSVSDDAPFFFFTLRTRDMLRQLATGDTRGIDWKVNLGVVVLGILLLISIAAVLLFLILPLALLDRARRAEGRRVGALTLLYFVAIGLGYILVEIAFIQRFVLFLGHPTYALTVVIFLMLLFSGLGSGAARRWFRDELRLAIPLVTIVLGLVALRFVLPLMLATLVGLPFAAKLVLSAAVLAPLGFAMGMPFPLGLELLSQRAEGSDNQIEWAWAMNAASSVLGSVLAMVIAIHFGLNLTLLAGAAAYLLALALGRWKLQPA